VSGDATALVSAALFGLDGFSVLAAAEAGGELELLVETTADLVGCEGMRILRTPVRAPRANAIAERWVGTARRELLDRMLIISRRHLMAVLTQYVGTSTITAHTVRFTKQHH
jgi:hypothetical protein